MPATITEADVAAAAVRLHGDGWWYSARQLYYASCAQVESPPLRVAQSEAGLGVLFILVGAITGNRTALLVLGAVGLLCIGAAIVTRRRESRPVTLARPLALSFAEFERRFCNDARRPGLLPQSAAIATPPRDSGALVLCDRPETAAVLVANAARMGDVRIGTAATHAPSQPAATTVVVLHDCDPTGCAIASDLRRGGTDVIDAGIVPDEVTGRRLQLIEGAPVRLDNGVAATLGADAAQWLREGRRLECATESPAALAQRVLGAMSQRGAPG